jgi:hypothetical protein
MESSEIQKRIINLGKALVKELGLDPGVDTLSRWMAHYIAEQMTIAENSIDDDRITAYKHCFETILNLWLHRSSLPPGMRPFENFDHIFRVLARLDPENSDPFFYRDLLSLSSGTDDPNDDQNDLQQWLNIALGIDQAARVWLEFVFHQAAQEATDEKTRAWLENAINLPVSKDISIIVKLLDEEADRNDETISKPNSQKRIEKLESRIKQLDAFGDFNQQLREAIVAELNAIKQGDTSDDVANVDMQ